VTKEGYLSVCPEAIPANFFSKGIGGSAVATGAMPAAK
jgi:hypothetical protein